MNTIDAIITRRITRSYKPDAVERDKLEKIIEAGRFAPSGGNNQTNHFIVVQDKAVLQKLATLAQDAFAKMEVTPETYSSLLGSCWINQIHWLTEDEKIFSCLRELGMKENERVFASMALGYAKDGLPNRKPLPRKGNEVTYI